MVQSSLNQAFQEFTETYPEYTQTASLDAIRSKDYRRIDDQNHVYLDYTGGGIYANSQIQQHMQLLSTGVYGNPHSSNPTSMAATELDEQARAYVLDYFRADPQEYVCIFTHNASGALKLLGESYPFDANSTYLLTFDNHNSVNGIREFARQKEANVHYAPVIPPDLRIDETKLVNFLQGIQADGNHLFAFPAQSNFSGVKHDLKWIEYAQALGWDVLLDAAAFAPTNRLDLSAYHPDFVVLSFYKMFGYPTGIGVLLARRDKLQKLQRPWFAGGTISIATVQGDTHHMHEGSEAFEDGTIDYLNLPAVEIGLRHIESIGIETIHERVRTITAWLLKRLTELHHSNGMPIARIYGPTTTDMRGGTISFNFFDPNGKLIDYRIVEDLANKHQISLRTGCFCNPGAGETAHGLTEDEIKQALAKEQRMNLDEFILVLGRIVGAVRISVGLVTNFEDVYRFMEFAHQFIDQEAETISVQ